MENYQMFFPGSSAASPSSMAASSSPNKAASSQVLPYNSSGATNFVSERSSSISQSLLGSPTEKYAADGRQLVIKDDDDHYSDDRAVNHHHSSAAENSGKMMKKKKMKKSKYAFQTRSQVDILDDGYRWRKYGQKAVKANRFPRSYYRCTYDGCNVKKQVQRLSKDEGIVVTSYEGMHTHPIDKPSSNNFEHILTRSDATYKLPS